MTEEIVMSEFLLKKSVFLLSIILTLTFTATAQTETNIKSDVTTAEQSVPNDETEKRIKQLEEQLETMRKEVEALKKSVTNNQPKIEEKQAENIVAKTETKQEEKKNTGVDLGSVRLTPYGTIYFNAFSNSAGTNNTDVPLFATPTGAANTSASVRQTRLGLKTEGAKFRNARLFAVVEADFFGGLPSVPIGENFGVVRLRLANARLDWEKTSLTIGQDWMPFAPLNPTSLAAAAIPQMATAGNNWARIPQIKLERKISSKFTFQGAILAPQTGDAPTNAAFFLQPTSGASSKIPFFQSRISFTEKKFFNTNKNVGIGLSGHYGRSKVFTGTGGNIENDIESVGAALDWSIPFSDRINFTGEAFFGRNLGGFQAGVFQSYNTDFAYRNGTVLVSGGVRAIGTRGGWMQLGFTPNVRQNKLSFYGSIGIDDPHNDDLISRTPRDFRTRNFAFAFDVIYKFSPQFQIGGEFRRLQTNYLLSGRRNAGHINLSAAYSF